MGKFIDLTGQKFGRLTVIELAGKNKYKANMWNCLCECGNHSLITTSSLRDGNNRSCGCLKREKLIEKNRKHGMRRTRECEIWYGIIKRCENKKDKEYKNYGGRGIKISEKWRNDFMEFYKDIGPMPSSKHSIDRIDVNGDYEPSNCRWATSSEQARNRRTPKSNTTGVKGIREIRNKWAVKIKINKKEIWLGTFKTLEEAIQVRKEAELKYWGKSS
jgi:hypothetical protein